MNRYKLAEKERTISALRRRVAEQNAYIKELKAACARVGRAVTIDDQAIAIFEMGKVANVR